MVLFDDRPSVPETTPRDAWERAAAGAALIVDVRETPELRLAAVEGARHIPLGQLPGAIPTLPTDQELLVLCHSGYRSAFATEYLLAAGFHQAKNIAGGIVEWAHEDLPLVIGDGERPRTSGAG